MANLYTGFANAIREGQTGQADGVPGVKSGLRGMVFIDAMLASAQSEQKWQTVSDVGTQ